MKCFLKKELCSEDCIASSGTNGSTACKFINAVDAITNFMTLTKGVTKHPKSAKPPEVNL